MRRRLVAASSLRLPATGERVIYGYDIRRWLDLARPVVVCPTCAREDMIAREAIDAMGEPLTEEEWRALSWERCAACRNPAWSWVLDDEPEDKEP